jgi:dTDP-4-dehydrorhamnose reductase
VRALELWGGCECTVNRVGDRYFDQIVRTGHQDRLSDLQRFADLGIKALRYPILWERTAPHDPDVRDFAWADARMAELRRLGINPIVGLTHHGSGPAYTNLLDDGFAPGLAAHARAVAQRYPWIRDWTPVNEPLTTARFSCLYGLWHPHARDDRSWMLALLNQIDATRLSMREIRRVVPGARLIQTEDLGYVHSPPALADQARFENDRRWLTWDLLSGRVVEGHPMHGWIAGLGFADRLAAIAADPCPPDVVGVNHYLTSERFLDERLDRYPGIGVGGNGRQSYVDVEAVRVARDGPLGLAALLRQTWERYGAAIAVTEIHNGSRREEQMRWFLEAWRGCEALRAEGVQIEAATAWSLLGGYDWPSLLTKDAGEYECGVFDLRHGAPRPTAMAGLLKTLAAGEAPVDHAFAVASPGWWRRPQVRYRFEPTAAAGEKAQAAAIAGTVLEAAPLLILGARTPLGRAFARHCRFRGLPFVLFDEHPGVGDDADAFKEALDQLAPAAVIDAARALTGDEIELCLRPGARLLRLSSAAVGAPHGLADARVLKVHIETPFCHDDTACFAVQALDALHHGRVFEAAHDQLIAPTYRPDVVDAALDLLIDGETGAWRLAHPERLSWAAFAASLAEGAGLDAGLVRGVPGEALGVGVGLSEASDLGSAREIPLPSLHTAITRFLSDYRAPAQRAPSPMLYAAE